LCSVGISAATASTARADDTKKACTDAYVAAQTLREAHRLKESREQLLACSRPGCTAFIVKDCVEWLAQVENSLPTVVLSAKDAAGH
jgi:hypothetical protein